MGRLKFSIQSGVHPAYEPGVFWPVDSCVAVRSGVAADADADEAFVVEVVEAAVFEGVLGAELCATGVLVAGSGVKVAAGAVADDVAEALGIAVTTDATWSALVV